MWRTGIDRGGDFGGDEIAWKSEALVRGGFEGLQGK